MRKLVASVAIAACVAVPTTIAILNVRSNDLEEITAKLEQVTDRNCAAINQIVTARNEAAAEGRVVVQQLIEGSAVEPQTAVERARTARFLDALFFTLEPIDCQEVP